MTITDPRPAILDTDPRAVSPAGPDPLTSHVGAETQVAVAGEGQDSPQAEVVAVPNQASPAGNATETSHGHYGGDAQPTTAVAADIPGGQPPSGTQSITAAGEQPPPATAKVTAIPMGPAPWLADPILKFTAQRLWDLEQTRIALDHRVRLFRKSTTDKDGQFRGSGISDDVLAVARVREIVSGEIDAAGIVAHLEDIAAGIKADEHAVELYLVRQWRKHPLRAWEQQRRGIGEKQIARLIGAIGDPYWNSRDARPRTVSALWKYCGFDVHDGEAPRRRERTRQTWSTQARSRAWLVAESCKRQLRKPCHVLDGHDYATHETTCECSPYRVIYDDARRHYQDAVHQKQCHRCGPSGSPAAPGTPLSAGHRQACGLRAAAKEILRDLWLEGRRLHQLNDN